MNEGVSTLEIKWLQPLAYIIEERGTPWSVNRCRISSSLPRTAWRSPARGKTLHHIHRHAVVLLESIPPTSPSRLLDQEEGEVIELYMCKPPEVLLVCGADRIEHRQQLHRAALN